jgi:hypothetical protein
VLDREVYFPLAGYAGSGFHTWPSGHIPSRPGSETAAQAGRRHCSRVRWPRFPHLAFRPHPSRPGSETVSLHPGRCQKDVRRGVGRGDRGERPPATKDPDPKPRRRRQGRYCSRVRWPRFPDLAPKPHPSRPGSETVSMHPARCQKNVRRGVGRGDRGQRPTATEEPWRTRHYPRATDTKRLRR